MVRILKPSEILFIRPWGESDALVIHIRENDIASAPNMHDPRFLWDCKSCSSKDRLVFSTRKNNHVNPEMPGAESHMLKCTCGTAIAEIPKVISMQELGDLEMPFGKHKGRRLNEIPRDYLAWCVANLDGNKSIHKKILAYLELNP